VGVALGAWAGAAHAGLPHLSPPFHCALQTGRTTERDAARSNAGGHALIASPSLTGHPIAATSHWSHCPPHRRCRGGSSPAKLPRLGLLGPPRCPQPPHLRGLCAGLNVVPGAPLLEEALLVVKWGGVLTHAGRMQAEQLGEWRTRQQGWTVMVASQVGGACSLARGACRRSSWVSGARTSRGGL